MIAAVSTDVQSPVAKLKKTSKVELWVSLRDFQGRRYVDIREHFFLADDHQWHPMKKGVMVPLALLDDVIEGVEALDGRTEVGTVAEIPKSKRDEIQVGLREFDEHRYGELRIWYADDGQKKPSNKGVTFRLTLVDGLLDALRAAKDVAGFEQ